MHYQISATVSTHDDVYNHDDASNDNKYDYASNNNDDHWTAEQC